MIFYKISNEIITLFNSFKFYNKKIQFIKFYNYIDQDYQKSFNRYNTSSAKF